MFKKLQNVLILTSFVALACVSGCASKSEQDAAISENVSAKLSSEPALTPVVTLITVDTQDGIVTLVGTVESSAQEQKAKEVAASVDGVKQVNSTLRIEPKITNNPTTNSTMMPDSTTTSPSATLTSPSPTTPSNSAVTPPSSNSTAPSVPSATTPGPTTTTPGYTTTPGTTTSTPASATTPASTTTPGSTTYPSTTPGSTTRPGSTTYPSTTPDTTTPAAPEQPQ